MKRSIKERVSSRLSIGRVHPLVVRPVGLKPRDKLMQPKDTLEAAL